ncbi:Tim44/TimA family putative adaptor protein [Azospirillum sp. SYSU D00513]|uniref:Tim44/TimA family putative adaptor protein n=1 Tax=Azospirillum sp. SYSU D00513 TaxID=2812561 RepID=UPI001A96306E|nr:Tim44/TimA family putative adaptor protein [Azospirillum sp. SYSU D00513]
MDDSFVLIEIVIFAMIAAFLVYRLRNVLGRRTGEERQRPNPFTPSEQVRPDNVVPMPERARAAGEPPAADEPMSLGMALDRLRTMDPSFEEKHFLQGARGAFQMIVEAFAAGDTATLRPLLSDEVYERFAAVIRQRQAAGEVWETRVLEVRDADVTAARFEGRTVYVTVQFLSTQNTVVRDAAGALVEGDPKEVEEVTDVWTFARDTRARDPNWALVGTGAAA